MKLNQKVVGVAVAMLGLLPCAAWASNNKICFEGESPNQLVSPLKKILPGYDNGYSGRGFLEIPWDRNKTKGLGEATYRVKVAKAGLYYLWARTFWQNGCGNSIAVAVNGSAPVVLGEDGTYDHWHWVGGTARVQLNASVNVFVIKNRETGVRVDQVFLCESGDYVPTGIRKITQ